MELAPAQPPSDPRPSDAAQETRADTANVTSCRVSALLALLCAVGAIGAATPARASQLIDRGATDVSLKVNAKGEALVTYRAAGTLHHVLVWGAVNALSPNYAAAQVKFKLDYAGGWGKYRNGSYWKSFPNKCSPYTGPTLAYEVAACTAPDGSYWALQAWHVALPDLGFTPWTAALAQSWLEVSHWTGPIAKLQVFADWVYNEHYHRLFGQLTYDNKPVFGFSSTRYGAPTDGYGRLVYVDALDAPAYGAGWHRENSFLTHSPSGIWCYGFYPKNPLKGGYVAPPGYDGGIRGPGIGTMYRVSVIGPGVTPDVSVTVQDPGQFNPSVKQEMRTQLLELGPDSACDRH